jgi:hypothetical protein
MTTPSVFPSCRIGQQHYTCAVSVRSLPSVSMTMPLGVSMPSRSYFSILPVFVTSVGGGGGQCERCAGHIAVQQQHRQNEGNVLLPDMVVTGRSKNLKQHLSNHHAVYLPRWLMEVAQSITKGKGSSVGMPKHSGFVPAGDNRGTSDTTYYNYYRAFPFPAARESTGQSSRSSSTGNLPRQGSTPKVGAMLGRAFVPVKPMQPASVAIVA